MKQPQKSLALQPVGASAQLAVGAFKKEVLKLQRKNVQLEAENFSLKARIKALEKSNPARSLAVMTDQELADELEKFAQAAGYVKNPKNS